MNRFSRRSRLAVTSVIFGATVAVLVVIAAVGYGLYATTSLSPSTVTITTTTSPTSEMTSSSSTVMLTSSGSAAYSFTPKSGAMISNAWLLVAPLGSNNYAVSIHAEGLEPNGTYLVEGPLSRGSMQVVPISNESMSMNHVGASEFQANINGTGLFWIQLGSNPMTTFEDLELAYLPGMSMQNATLVATASFTQMNSTTAMSSTESMMTTSTSQSMATTS